MVWRIDFAVFRPEGNGDRHSGVILTINFNSKGVQMNTNVKALEALKGVREKWRGEIDPQLLDELDDVIRLIQGEIDQGRVRIENSKIEQIFKLICKILSSSAAFLELVEKFFE